VSRRRALRFLSPSVALVLAALLTSCGGSSDDQSTPATSGLSRPTSAATVPTTALPGPLVQQAEPSLPAPVQESAAASTQTRLYVVGGFDSNRQSVASVWVFDGTSWSSGPPLPIALNHPAATAVGDDVLVAGGFNNGTATNRAFVLHEGAPAWADVSPLHDARGAAALVTVAGTPYVIGGNAGGAQIADVERFDPAAGTWTVVTQLPRPRNHLAGFVLNGQACVAGGREPATSTSIDCLDPSTLGWTSISTLPTPTSGAAAGVVQGTLFVAGGEPSGEGSIVPVVQQLIAGAWSTQPMLVPRHGTGFAAFGGRVWMCGGATAPGYAAVADCTSIGSG
jgi:hypothetical protein